MTLDNTYTGFHPPNSGWKPDRLDAHTTDAEHFFHNYIKKRQPCILYNLLKDKEWAAPEKWTLNFITAKAGQAPIWVEQRTKAGAFGGGQERLKMSFGDFSKKLASGATDLYLTTQYDSSATEKDSSEPEWKSLLPEPLPHLFENFPLRPKILGNLIPQQLNLWLGACDTKGASSGLHHDFQDNLYILLEGRKNFNLFSPKDVNAMYLYGEVDRVYPNGMINYVGQLPSRGDGALQQQVHQWRITNAEAALKKAEDTGMDTEEAEDELLKLLLKGERHDVAQAGGTLHETEYEESMTSYESKPGSDDDYIVDEEFDHYEQMEYEHESDSDVVEPLAKKAKTQNHSTPEPPNFSRIPAGRSHEDSVINEFDKLKSAVKVNFDLHKSEMLFLPAGWFHEVTSYGQSDGNRVHMAFNYWLAPPTENNFEEPYCDSYHVDTWKTVQQSMPA